jgi:hypothetical protein
MSGIRIARWAAAAVAAFGFFGTTVLAQPPGDILTEARARQKIADQKAEAEVVQTIADADRLARTNSARAIQLLQATQTNVDLSAAISPDARKTLTALLQTKVIQLKGGAAPANPGVKLDPNGAAVKANQKAEWESVAVELKAVREGINNIERMQAAGRTQEANLATRDLAKLYPNNPAVITLLQNGNSSRQLSDARLYADASAYRYNEAMKLVDKSATPPLGDIEFPDAKKWQDLTARRRTMSEVQLTDKEKKVISALDKPVTVDFNNRPLEEALQDLSNQMDQPLAIDTKSISDLGVDLKKPFSFQARGVSGRTVLRQALASQGLTFVVKDEIIQVVTVERARDMLVARVYYLGDLTQGGVGSPFSGAMTAGTFLEFQQSQANVKLIIDAIESSIDPLCWKKSGGPCTITYNPASNAIIVRAPAEVHAALGGKLSGGK